MTNRMNSRKGLARMTWALVLALVTAICMSCIAMAAEAKTAEQTLRVSQSILKENDDGSLLYDDPARSNYTYRLTPQTDGAPMPDEASEKTGVYEFVLKGDAEKEIKLTFTLDKPQKYLYEVARVEKTPDGDIVTPETHLFGYLIEQDEDGNYTIIPFTCYDNHMEFVVDEKTGEPTGIVLNNTIRGRAVDKATDGKDGKDGANGKDGSNSGSSNSGGSSSNTGTGNKSGTSTNGTTNVVTRTVNRVVNTGDPYQVGLWLLLLGVSAAAMVILGIVRRRKEKDEEES